MTFPTAVLTSMAVAVEGQIATDAGIEGMSGVAYGTMLPGHLVVWHAGDADAVVRLPTTAAEITGSNPRGVLPYEGLAPNNPYLAGDAVAPLSSGEIWVIPEDAVTPATPVYVRFATGDTAVLGSFRGDVDTTNGNPTAALFAGARYMTSGGSGTTPVRLRLNF